MASLVLASQSPRRVQLLTTLGLEFIVDPAEMDETARLGERPDALVRRLAVAKALVVGRRHTHATILGSDTIVAKGTSLFGKPRTVEAAEEMLRKLSGTRHQVYTGVALWIPKRGRGYVRVAVAHVTFRDLSALEIREYAASGEPLDKAGAYAIQGQAGRWVTAFEGNLETVMGLPTDVVQKLLRHGV